MPWESFTFYIYQISTFADVGLSVVLKTWIANMLERKAGGLWEISSFFKNMDPDKNKKI